METTLVYWGYIGLYGDPPMWFLFGFWYGFLVRILFRTTQKVLHWRVWVNSTLHQDPPSTLKRDLCRSYLGVVGLYRGHLGGLGNS